MQDKNEVREIGLIHFDDPTSYCLGITCIISLYLVFVLFTTIILWKYGDLHWISSYFLEYVIILLDG